MRRRSPGRQQSFPFASAKRPRIDRQAARHGLPKTGTSSRGLNYFTALVFAVGCGVLLNDIHEKLSPSWIVAVIILLLMAFGESILVLFAFGLTDALSHHPFFGRVLRWAWISLMLYVIVRSAISIVFKV
jgi:hypothetical protein